MPAAIIHHQLRRQAREASGRKPKVTAKDECDGAAANDRKMKACKSPSLHSNQWSAPARRECAAALAGRGCSFERAGSASSHRRHRRSSQRRACAVAAGCCILVDALVVNVVHGLAPQRRRRRARRRGVRRRQGACVADDGAGRGRGRRRVCSQRLPRWRVSGTGSVAHGARRSTLMILPRRCRGWRWLREPIRDRRNVRR